MELVLPLISLVLMGYGSAGNASVHLFTHHTMLDKAGRVELSWTPGPEGITFRLEVAAHGYVGIGFSPGGGMNGADMVLAWVKDGLVTLEDRHAEGNSVPKLDRNQCLGLGGRQ